MRISIQQAINSKECYIYAVTETDWDDHDTDKPPEYIFKIKITGFEKIDLPAARKEMDEYDLEKLDSFLSNAGGCDLWILKVEVINLNKTTMTGLPIIKSLFIEDSDSFQFPKCSHHFVNYTEFAENKKMNVFSGCYPPDVPLLPKVPTEGSIPFLLPKDEKNEYYLFIKGEVNSKTENGVETKIEHDNGWIYVLTNPTFQRNLLKIGVTQRTPEERALEMSRQTGLPKPFSVHFKIEVNKCNMVEKIIHDKLAKYRYTANREFFEVPLEEVVSFIKKVAYDYPKEKVPDPEELKKQQKIKEIEKKMKQLKEELAELEKCKEEDSFENRVLCSDGRCIGVIGPDGKCKECGQPYEPLGNK